MANVKKFSRDEAVALRQQGMGYAEISTQLGCSYAWCAKALRGVDKGVVEAGLAEEVKWRTKEQVIAMVEDLLVKIRSM